MTYPKEKLVTRHPRSFPQAIVSRVPTSPRRGGALSAVAILGVLAASAASCDRAHLTATYGRAYHQAFATQAVNPDRPRDAKSIEGLDSQEAAIISSSYRRSLAPKDQTGVDRPQLLMSSPRTGLREAALPPPSVPGDR